MNHKIFITDPQLARFEADFDRRARNLRRKKREIGCPLTEFADGYSCFGFHRTESGWVYREWAPNAEKMYLTGDFNRWDRHGCPMTRGENGVFEVTLPGRDALLHGQRVMAILVTREEELERIPAYMTRVEQDYGTFQWHGVIQDPYENFAWKNTGFIPKNPLFIYECHIGMAQEEGKVSSYDEFRRFTLPRIRDLGYNTIQIIGIMEHPYYGSFGYQVANFFAASSRFGTPEDLKRLIDEAHGMGIAVLLDLVHSHACKNTREGLAAFDGTQEQYFHPGPRGHHPAWDTKCFDYGKKEVLRFLLSNLKYWMTEYRFDGFRFDGVGSMLYQNHGLGVHFQTLEQYFSENTDLDAVTYLQLANQLIHKLNSRAITIAEDVSAMPGITQPVSAGGLGFDYRLAMGEPDLWVKLLTNSRDEYWDLNRIYFELANRRPGEKRIGYCESHDQAFVGDQTIMSRLCRQELYHGMGKYDRNLIVDRGVALHKLIRLLTMSLGGDGYLTFMGNEFGHPDWIDFPREGNGWSYHYCRRQWSLADDPNLKFQGLRDFERDMVSMAKEQQVLSGMDRQLRLSNDEKILVYGKGKAVFAFNFHASWSQEGVFVPVPEPGDYRMIFTSDDYCYGGHGRIYHDTYPATQQEDGWGFRVYLPSRTAAVFVKA